MKKLKILAGSAISIIFIAITFGQLDFAKISASIQSVNFLLLPFAVALFYVDVMLVSTRWSYQIAMLKERRQLKTSIPITPFSLFPALSIGYFGNNVFPARAGEFLRAFSLCKIANIPKASVLATIVIERIFDGLAMVSLAVLSSLFFSIDSSMNFVIRASTVLFVLVLLLSFGLVLFPERGERMLDFILSYLPQKTLRLKVKHIYHSFLEPFRLLPNVKSVFILYVLSLGNWFFEGTVYYVTALAFGIELPLYMFTFTAAITSLTTLIPAGPGYVGTFHLVVTKILMLFAVEQTIAASYSIVVHLVLWMPITLVGTYYAFKYGFARATEQEFQAIPTEESKSLPKKPTTGTVKKTKT